MSTATGAEAYLICGTPRTGSTLLCGLLRSTGVAGRPESYFRVPDEPAWADRWRLPRDPAGRFDDRDYVRAALAAGRTPNGVFGCRVMWGTLEPMRAKLAAASPDLTGADLGLVGADLGLLAGAFGPIRFVHLWREDTVAQAVSWARAEQTGYWHPGDAPRSADPPRFDPAQVRELVGRIGEHHAAWRDWFARVGVRPHPVRYEDLAADPAGVTGGVLDFLGLRLPAGRTIASPPGRQADRLNDEWIARYRGHDPGQGG